MRITHQMKLNMLMRDINLRQNDLLRTTHVLMTGNEVDVPSDNPAMAARAMVLMGYLDRHEQHKENIVDGIAALSYAEAELQHVVDLLNESRSAAISASNSALSSADRYALGIRIEGILNDMIATANARHEGQYIFGGFNTQESPYTFTMNSALGLVTAVFDKPQFMDGRIYRITSDGEQIPGNILGSEIFQTGNQGEEGDMFQVLIDLRDALFDGIENDATQNPPGLTRSQYDSLTVIQESINSLDVASELVSRRNLELGDNVRRLLNTEEKLEDINIRTNEHLAATQGADLTEYISKFQMQSLALQNAVSLGAQILRLSSMSFF